MTHRGNPNPNVATRIKKGQVLNPRGAGAHNHALKNLKRLSKAELVDITNLLVKDDIKGLKALLKKKDASVIQVMLASVCIKVIEKGDMHSLDMLLNRLIGKVKDELDINSLNPPQLHITLPSNGRESKKP